MMQEHSQFSGKKIRNQNSRCSLDEALNISRWCQRNGYNRSGAHFTDDFSIVIQFRWKCPSVLLQVVVKWLLWYLAHDATTMMSWPAKNFVSILYPIVELHWNQISIEFQLPWKSCSCNGLQVCVYTCFLDSFGFDFNQQAVKFPDLSLIVTPLISSGRRSLQSNKYWIQYVYAIIIAFISFKARSLNLIVILSKLCCLNKLDDILHTTYWNVLSLKKLCYFDETFIAVCN